MNVPRKYMAKKLPKDRSELVPLVLVLIVFVAFGGGFLLALHSLLQDEFPGLGWWLGVSLILAFILWAIWAIIGLIFDDQV
jgi:hypothetical protein